MKNNPIYTKTGDEGTTIVNGKKVNKDSCLTETLGEIDSLMASIDKITYGLDILPDMKIHNDFTSKIQDALLHLGGEMSNIKTDDPITNEFVLLIEKHIDLFDNLKLNSFIRFSNPIAMDIDEARIRTRKVERKLTQLLRDFKINDDSYKFINRLSDYFFVLAVYIDRKYR